MFRFRFRVSFDLSEQMATFIRLCTIATLSFCKNPPKYWAQFQKYIETSRRDVSTHSKAVEHG